MLRSYAQRKGVHKPTALRDLFSRCLQRHTVSIGGEQELNYIFNSMRPEQYLHQVHDDEDDENDFITVADSDGGDDIHNVFSFWPRLFAMKSTHIRDEETPLTLKEIYDHAQSWEWTEAYDEEITSYKSNDVLDIIDRSAVPKGHRVHTLKPVMKLKTNQNLETIRRKVRITLRGFLTRYGLEYDQTYAPTLQASTFKLMMAIMSAYGLVGAGLDVKTAFLTADVNHDVYCEVPERWNGNKPNDPTKVAKLKKAVYGCKDSSRNFYLKVNQVMLAMGFTVSRVDQCLWTKGKIADNTFVGVGFYVDDASVIASTPQLKDGFLKEIQRHFAITQDPLTEMLGIKIDRDENGVTITQNKYVRSILRKLGFENDGTNKRTHQTPLPTSRTAPPHIEETELDATGITRYQQKLGSLIYCLGTRIDCCYAISKLCRFMHAPTHLHEYWADYLCEYLNGNPSLGIQYPVEGDKLLTAHCDASYVDGEDGKSTVGYLVAFNGSVISFKSKLSKHVCTSTSMAEYVGLYECTKTVMLMRRLLEDLTVPQTTKTVIRCDNESAIEVANAEIHVASHRHIQMRYHYTRECLNEVEINHVKTTEQPADILTKALPKVTLLKHRDNLMSKPQ